MLEEDVAVLVGAAHDRALGVERAFAEGLDRVHVDHPGQVVVVPDLDLLDLVGGAEAVEEVDEGDAALDGGQVRHGAQVHDLLRVALGEHREAGLAAGVDVGVVAEDVQRVGGDGTGRNMEDARQQFAGELIHVGDHEQQALGGGIGGGQGAGGQRAVHGARRARLGLHLHDLDGGAEDILTACGGPLVDVVGHRAGRRDRVDPRYLGKRIADMRCRGIAVHGEFVSCHVASSS